MSINHLIELRERLETERKERLKYAILPFEARWSDLETLAREYPIPKSEEEIEVQTDEFINRCESLMEKSLIFLEEKDLPVDKISIASNKMSLCKLGTVKEASNTHKNLKNRFGIEFDGFIFDEDYLFGSIELDYDSRNMVTAKFFEAKNRLTQDILPRLVPLRVELDVNSAVNGDESLEFVGDDIEWKKFSEENAVTGVVDFDLFVSKMKELGYDVSCSNSSDYLSNAREDYLFISANLTKKKDLEEKNGFGAM